MTTYAFPAITPRATTISYGSNTKTHRSPTTSGFQTVSRGGELIRISMTFGNLRTTERAELLAFMVKLNGHQHRFTLSNHAENQLGAYGGTPLVAGVNQLGTMLAIDGCSNNITDWQKAFDWFGVGNELKIATEDADTNGSGETTLAFRPRLRTAPADNDPVIITAATGVFLLEEPDIDWLNQPWKDGPLSDITVNAIEDVNA